MKQFIKKGKTSQRIAVKILDSSQTDGRGLTALVFNSAGLTAYYWREDQGNVGATVITLATATRGTFTSSGFIEKDATNMPGWYEIGIPDAALATGANWVGIQLKGATNMAQVDLEIELVDFDPADGVRLGLTALPNAAAAATGGVPTVDASNAVKVQSGTGANQIDLTSGRVKIAGAYQKNTALSNFAFMMVDSADDVSPKTGLTVAGTISKDGAAFVALTNAISEIANGMYKVNLTAAELNADVVILRFTGTGANDRLIVLISTT